MQGLRTQRRMLWAAAYPHSHCRTGELLGMHESDCDPYKKAGWSVKCKRLWQCRDRFVAGPSNSVTRKELGALFDVIGTPSWADVDQVQAASWRSYLQKLPGRAPTLVRRLGFAGAPSQTLPTPTPLKSALFLHGIVLHPPAPCSTLPHKD